MCRLNKQGGGKNCRARINEVKAVANRSYDDYLEELSNQQSPQPEQEPPAKPPRKPRRRVKISQQQIMLLAAIALAAILLISVIVMVFRNIIGGGGAASSVPSSVPTSSAPPASEPEPLPSYPVAADPDVWNLKVINNEYPIAANYSPPDMSALVAGGVQYWVDERIAEPLQNMINACNAETGGSLRIISAYRSYTKQKESYDYYMNNYTTVGQNEQQAKETMLRENHQFVPGTSDHHSGLSVDFVTGTVQTPTASFAETPEYAWLVQHAAEYGFVLRYPDGKQDITGVPFCPYHFRYVGADEAVTITNAGVTLEEYVRKTPGAQTEPESTPASEPLAGSQPVSAAE